MAAAWPAEPVNGFTMSPILLIDLIGGVLFDVALPSLLVGIAILRVNFVGGPLICFGTALVWVRLLGRLAVDEPASLVASRLLTLATPNRAPWFPNGPAFPLQLISSFSGSDRQIAHALAGGMVYGVGDCRRDAAQRDLRQAF